MKAGNPASSVTEAETQLQSHLERKVFSGFYYSSVPVSGFFSDLPWLANGRVPATQATEVHFLLVTVSVGDCIKKNIRL